MMIFKRLKAGEFGWSPLTDPGEALRSDQLDREWSAAEKFWVEQSNDPGGQREPGPGDEDPLTVGTGVEQCLDQEGARQQQAPP